MQRTLKMLALLTLATCAQAAPLQVKGYCLVDRLVTTKLNVYGEVTNTTSSPLSAKGTLEVRDRSGNLLKHSIGLPPFAVINPGESLPVFEYGSIGPGMASCVPNYSATPTSRGLRGQVSGLNVVYDNLGGMQSADITARVTNTEGRTGYGILTVTGYDSAGRVVMIGSHSVGKLLAGESQAVKFIALNVMAKPVRFRTLLDLGSGN